MDSGAREHGSRDGDAEPECVPAVDDWICVLLSALVYVRRADDLGAGGDVVDQRDPEDELYDEPAIATWGCSGKPAVLVPVDISCRDAVDWGPVDASVDVLPTIGADADKGSQGCGSSEAGVQEEGRCRNRVFGTVGDCAGTDHASVRARVGPEPVPVADRVYADDTDLYARVGRVVVVVEGSVVACDGPLD